MAVATEAFDLSVQSGCAIAFPAIDKLCAKLSDDVPGVVELGERLATV